MLEYRHVRFRLTELLKAAEFFMEIEDSSFCGPPTAQEAFDWYWNLCAKNGWRLVAVSSGRDGRTVVSYLERNSQLNLRCEEYWNIVWETQGDQAIESRFDPDVVHGEQHLEVFHAQISAELYDRGWLDFGAELHMGGQVIKSAWFPGTVSRVGPIADSLEIQAGTDAAEIDQD